jgi:hypothetical protein
MKQGEINMSRSIARKLEKRHEAIMKYTGGDMISFVLTCTELQKEMLTELERLNERLIDEIVQYANYRQIKDDEANQLKGELTQYKSLVHEMGKMISRDWKLNATTWNKLTDEYLGSEEE